MNIQAIAPNPFLTFQTTTPALMAQQITCARRNLAPEKARQLLRNSSFDAMDVSPDSGGTRLMRCVLTNNAHYEPLNKCTKADYETEGWAHMNRIDPVQFNLEEWRKRNQSDSQLAVIRFEIIEIIPPSDPVQVEFYAHLREHFTNPRRLENYNLAWFLRLFTDADNQNLFGFKSSLPVAARQRPTRTLTNWLFKYCNQHGIPVDIDTVKHTVTFNRSKSKGLFS